MKCGGTGIHRDRMTSSHIAGKLFFKLFDFYPTSQPPGSKRLNHRLDLILTNLWNMKRYKHRRYTSDRSRPAYSDRLPANCSQLTAHCFLLTVRAAHCSQLTIKKACR